MTTSVKLSMTHVPAGKAVRVQQVDPVSGNLSHEFFVTEKEVAKGGGTFESQALYLHAGSRLAIDEVDEPPPKT